MNDGMPQVKVSVIATLTRDQYTKVDIIVNNDETESHATNPKRDNLGKLLSWVKFGMKAIMVWKAL